MEKFIITHHYIITAVFSVTWSFRNHSICWFAAQETFLIIINVENSCAASYLCGKRDGIFLSQQIFETSLAEIFDFVTIFFW